MSLSERMHFLQDVFQMTVIALVSVINYYHIWRQLHKNAVSNFEQVLEATPHKAPALRPPTSHHEKLSKLYEPDMQDTAGEAGTSS